MATIISHPALPLALGIGLGTRIIPTRLLIAGCIASMLPDADVIAFAFGIPYASQFGHRGFTHSIVFAVFVGVVVAALGARKLRAEPWTCFAFLCFATMSHALLDAFTNGGLGVALLWPLDHQRWFFWVQPIQVSPIGIEPFFSARGVRVLISECYWIWLPSLALTGILVALRNRAKPT